MTPIEAMLLWHGFLIAICILIRLAEAPTHARKARAMRLEAEGVSLNRWLDDKAAAARDKARWDRMTPDQRYRENLRRIRKHQNEMDAQREALKARAGQVVHPRVGQTVEELLRTAEAGRPARPRPLKIQVIGPYQTRSRRQRGADIICGPYKYEEGG